MTGLRGCWNLLKASREVGILRRNGWKRSLLRGSCAGAVCERGDQRPYPSDRHMDRTSRHAYGGSWHCRLSLTRSLRERTSPPPSRHDFALAACCRVQRFHTSSRTINQPSRRARAHASRPWVSLRVERRPVHVHRWPPLERLERMARRRESLGQNLRSCEPARSRRDRNAGTSSNRDIPGNGEWHVRPRHVDPRGCLSSVLVCAMDCCRPIH